MAEQIVNPTNYLLGLRELPWTEGVTAAGTLHLVSGSSGISGQVTNFQLTVAEPCEGSEPVLSFSGASDADFSLVVSSPALDYALRNKTEGTFKADIRFDFSGQTFALNSILTTVNNNPTVKAETSFLSRSESGQFAPSGVMIGKTGVMFSHSLAAGENAFFVPFPAPFATTPVVTYVLNIPTDGSLFTMATSGVNPTGFPRGIPLFLSQINFGAFWLKHRVQSLSRRCGSRCHLLILPGRPYWACC